MHKLLTACLALSVLLMHNSAIASSPHRWIDTITLSLGKDNDSNDTDVFRIGFQNKWKHTWFDGGAWYLGGYWDTGLALMETDYGRDNELLDFSLTGVFRFQRDANLSSGLTPFAEAGIGPHLVSDTRLGKRDLTTAFQLGSIVGFGVGFGERGQYELSYRFQHISNGDIKKPNDTLDLHLLRLGYSFD